jgi:hypothetical protein
MGFLHRRRNVGPEIALPRFTSMSGTLLRACSKALHKTPMPAVPISAGRVACASMLLWFDPRESQRI